MIDQYIDAAIRQARERARVLKTKMPQPVKSPELVSLQRVCESQLDGIIAHLDYLLTDDVILAKDVVKERSRMFRRCLGQLARIETTAIAALSRVHEDDIFLNKLVFQIHREINYPIPPPTVTCLSRNYFSISTGLELLEVPLAESDFLLHLPDLYHELGHSIIATPNNPRVEPFQRELGKFMFIVSQHFEAERGANIRATGPTAYNAQVLDLLERSWGPWAEEFFCDLFAVYTLGPAYGWAHFHLTAGHEGDPFDIRLTGDMTHPPDHARMEAILIALDLIGFKHQASAISQRWSALVNATGATQAPMYRKACPPSLLQRAAIHALEGTKRIGCRIVQETTSDNVHILLSSAWEKLWQAPADYQHWERQRMAELKQASAAR